VPVSVARYRQTPNSLRC